jgi:hypothetical protein
LPDVGRALAAAAPVDLAAELLARAEAADAPRPLIAAARALLASGTRQAPARGAEAAG